MRNCIDIHYPAHKSFLHTESLVSLAEEQHQAEATTTNCNNKRKGIV